MWRLLPLMLFALPASADLTDTWSCVVAESLGASVVGGLDRRPVPERPGFEVQPSSGFVSASGLPGFARGQLLIAQPGTGETWAAWWRVENERGERADMLRLAGEPASGELRFLALHEGRLYAGECKRSLAGGTETSPYLPAKPPQAELATYYNCLAVYLHQLSATGLSGYRVDTTMTPRFQLDTRNGALIGRVVEGFASGRSVVRQPGPGQPWLAWWIRMDREWSPVDMLYLEPLADTRKQRGTFVALHQGWLFTGICSATERTGDYPPPPRAGDTRRPGLPPTTNAGR